jgi:hypothetical protein
MAITSGNNVLELVTNAATFYRLREAFEKLLDLQSSGDESVVDVSHVRDEKWLDDFDDVNHRTVTTT